MGWLTGVAGGVVTAQDAKAPASTEAAVPLRIELVLSRHDGDKVVSNLPFALLTTLGENTLLRMGSEVPIQNEGPVNYQSVGTSIDTRVESAGPGMYQLSLGVEDSSVAERIGAGLPNNPTIGAPVFRSNRLRTVLIIRDGETAELVVATDKVSGETLKAQVRVTALD